MKKMFVPTFVLATVVCAVLVLYGATQGWFGSKAASAPPTSTATFDKDQSGRVGESGPPAEEVIGAQAMARLDSIRKATPQDFAKAVQQWGQAAGADRKVSWEAVRSGASAAEDRQVRLRACQLAQAMAAGRPEGVPVPPPADKRAVEPLLECLKSGDAALVQVAATALGTIHLLNPSCKVEQRAVPEIRGLLVADDPGLASSALSAVTFFGEAGLAPDVLSSWEKHAKAPGFGESAAGKLRILMELKLREEARKAHPDWSKTQCLAQAKPRTQELAGRFGTDLGKWKAWWSTPAEMP